MNPILFFFGINNGFSAGHRKNPDTYHGGMYPFNEGKLYMRKSILAKADKNDAPWQKRIKGRKAARRMLLSRRTQVPQPTAAKPAALSSEQVYRRLEQFLKQTLQRDFDRIGLSRRDPRVFRMFLSILGPTKYAKAKAAVDRFAEEHNARFYGGFFRLT